MIPALTELHNYCVDFRTPSPLTPRNTPGSRIERGTRFGLPDCDSLGCHMTATSYKVRIPGEVVGMFERGSEKIAKICLRPYCIEVNIIALKEPHLGDEVVVDGNLSVEHVVLFNEGIGGDEERDGQSFR
jgi:hypothetical protein